MPMKPIPPTAHPMIRGRLVEEEAVDAATTVLFAWLPVITGGGEGAMRYLGIMACTENYTIAVGAMEESWI